VGHRGLGRLEGLRRNDVVCGVARLLLRYIGGMVVYDTIMSKLNVRICTAQSQYCEISQMRISYSKGWPNMFNL